MIVVAIIGILAAIAIPAYQDYTQRAQIGEAFTIVSSAKTAVAEFRQTNGAYPTDTDITNLKLDIASGAGKYVNAIDVQADGDIQVTMAATGVGSDIQGKFVRFTPPTAAQLAAGQPFVWNCVSDAEVKFLPKNCTTGS